MSTNGAAGGILSFDKFLEAVFGAPLAEKPVRVANFSESPFPNVVACRRQTSGVGGFTEVLGERRQTEAHSYTFSGRNIASIGDADFLNKAMDVEVAEHEFDWDETDQLVPQVDLNALKMEQKRAAGKSVPADITTPEIEAAALNKNSDLSMMEAEEVIETVKGNTVMEVVDQLPNTPMVLTDVSVASTVIEGAYLNVTNIGAAGRILFDVLFSDQDMVTWSLREDKRNHRSSPKLRFIKAMLAFLQERPNINNRTMEGFRKRLTEEPQLFLSENDEYLLKKKVFISYATRRRQGVRGGANQSLKKSPYQQ